MALSGASKQLEVAYSPSPGGKSRTTASSCPTLLIAIVGEESLFETGLLLAGEVDPNDVRRQLSRWVKAGRLYQLRRGLYALAPPFQKVKPHPFVVAR